MLKFLYYTALILGLYFLFKYIVKLLLVLFVHNAKKKIFKDGSNVEHNSDMAEEETIKYKQKPKQNDSDIIEFEEE